LTIRTGESAEIGPGWGFLRKSGGNGEFALKAYRESVREEPSFFDKVFVPPGDYTFCGIKGLVQTPFGKLLSAVITVDAGSFYDGSRVTVGIKYLVVNDTLNTKRTRYLPHRPPFASRAILIKYSYTFVL
jgi:hypothetical protein